MPDPSPEMVRLTLWISQKERDGVEQVASERHASLNFIGRSAIRQYLEEAGVTLVTRNIRNGK